LVIDFYIQRFPAISDVQTFDVRRGNASGYNEEANISVIPKGERKIITNVLVRFELN